jgi:hypothetical protein
MRPGYARLVPYDPPALDAAGCTAAAADYEGLTEVFRFTSRPQISPCPAPFGANGCNPDFLNVDLTATKSFGKWAIGPVAFGSTDMTTPVAGYQRQSQIALGGLVGYDFGPIIVQGYVTTDVYEKNYGGFDTRVWGRLIIPIWNPAAPAPTPEPLYRG